MAWRWAPWLAASAEVGLVYPFVLLLWGTAGSAPVPAWLWAGVILGGTGTSLVVYARLSSLAAMRLSIAGAGVLVAGLTLLCGHTYDPVVALALGLAWWRGVAAAQYGQDPGAASEAIVRLAGVSTVPLLLQVVMREPGWSATVAPYYLLLFVASLGTLAAARAESLRRRQASAVHPDRDWSASGSLAAVTNATLLLVPALLVWAVGWPHLPSLVKLIGVLGRWSATVAVWMAVAVFFVLQWPIRALAAVLRRLAGSPVSTSPGTGSAPLRFPSVEPRPLPAVWLDFLGVLALVLLLAVIGQIIYRAVYRLYRMDTSDEVPEERESVFEWRKVWRRRARGGRRTVSAGEMGSGVAARVRRLYRRLQVAGEAAGRRRELSETPAEYMRALEQSSLSREVVQCITALYQDVRYGDIMPDDTAVKAAERAAADGLPGEGAASYLSAKPPVGNPD